MVSEQQLREGTQKGSDDPPDVTEKQFENSGRTRFKGGTAKKDTLIGFLKRKEELKLISSAFQQT